MFPKNKLSQEINYPLVSVIIPVYNGIKNGLEICLNSVISQTYQNLQIIVVNDGSEDSSKDLISNLINDNRIKYLEHQQNMGLSATWNDGILLAEGDFLVLLQQDCSFADPNTVELVVQNVIEEQILFLTGYQECESNKLNIFQRILRIRINEGGTHPFSHITTLLTENKCDFIASSLMKHIGSFDEKFPNVGQDLLFSMKLTKLGVEIKISDKLRYNIMYNGEDTYKKLLFKEFSYGLASIPLYLTWRRNNFSPHSNNSVDLASKKLHSRLFNVIFPFFWSISLLANFFIISNYTFFSSVILLIGWVIYNLTKIFDNNRKNKKAKIPIVRSLFILTSLDFVYMAGALFGSLKFK